MYAFSGAPRRFVLPCLTLLVSTLGFSQESNNAVLDQLRGHTYRLTAATVGDQTLPLPDQPAITVRFGENGKLSGHSVVNLFLGSLQLDAEGTVQWNSAGFAVTRRSGPQTLMDLENLFLQLFERTSRLALEGETLTFSSTDPSISLVFQIQPDRRTAVDIYNKSLTLVRLKHDGREIALPSKPLLNLTVKPEGTCYGFSGVNRYFGKLEIATGGSVKAGPLGSTMMAGPQELMDLETAFHKALTAATRVEFAGTVVRFSDASGASLLEFQAR